MDYFLILHSQFRFKSKFKSFCKISNFVPAKPFYNYQFASSLAFCFLFSFFCFVVAADSDLMFMRA